jgi:hypothetical protein
MKLGRNDPCWCGSARKYKKCHLNREKERALALPEAAREFAKASARRMCLHPEASEKVCTSIVNAHTVQRARVLAALVDDSNHVLTFHTQHGRWNENGPFKVGWRDASTFTGFCSHHDSTTFAPLEAVPFTGTSQQCFLHMYRAVCFELHAKLGAVRAGPAMRDALDRGADPNHQQRIQSMLSSLTVGQQTATGDLKRIKSVLDRALVAQDYTAVDSTVIDLAGQLNIAATGLFTPDLDIQNTRLQDLTTLSKPIQGMTVSSDVTVTGCALVFSWLATDTVPARFLDSLFALDAARIAALLPQLMFLHLENTYFSVRWWSSLSTDIQKRVIEQAWTFDPRYTGQTLVQENIWLSSRMSGCAGANQRAR